jgi:hypothetical protein
MCDFIPFYDLHRLNLLQYKVQVWVLSIVFSYSEAASISETPSFFSILKV